MTSECPYWPEVTCPSCEAVRTAPSPEVVDEPLAQGVWASPCGELARLRAALADANHHLTMALEAGIWRKSPEVRECVMRVRTVLHESGTR